MYSAQLTSKKTKIIATDTITLPASELNSNLTLDYSNNNPLFLEIFLENEALFKITIKFETNSNEHAFIDYGLNKNTKTFDFIFSNIKDAKKPITLPEPVLLAKANGNKEFYISLAVSPTPYTYQLSYTIFLMSLEESHENRSK